MSESMIGVIGGTGLYAMDGLEVKEEREVETPFGSPSDPIVLGQLDGRSIAFLPRHGRGHRLLPSEINYRANLFALKSIGVTHLISISAVGSMKEAYEPGHVVLPDQFMDRTRQRADTFFGDGLVVHVSLADPVCPVLVQLAAEALRGVSTPVHVGGTYVCIEGPQFSTRAESQIYRQWGVDVIGMTNMQEARLAREAEMCFVCLAFVTDYDCWKDDEEAVSGESVMAVLARNVSTSRQVLAQLVPLVQAMETRECACPDALRAALITDLEKVPKRVLEALDPLIGRYLRESRS